MATGMNITPACTTTTLYHTPLFFFCVQIRTTMCKLFTRENLLKKYKCFKQKLHQQHKLTLYYYV